MKVSELKEKALLVRRRAFEMQGRAGKGHLGGAFSVTEILVAIYYSGIFRTSREWFNKSGRDRIFFSKGHACLALYPILADLGFFSEKELLKYGENGTILGGHPDHHIPGVEISSGSLGHGLGVASGLALSAKLDKKDFLSIAILGDGECAEGSIWEAAAFSSYQKLGKLVVIVDNNGVGATSTTEYFGLPKQMAGRWKAFGWDTVEIDGHDFSQILAVLKTLRSRKSDRPLAIIACTIKGRGVSFMENDHSWHHGVPRDEKLKIAKRELGL